MSPEAHDLFMRGQFEKNKLTPQGFDRALVYFRRALDLDPDYAQAHAGIGFVYDMQADVYAPSHEYHMLAMDAARRAVDVLGQDQMIVTTGHDRAVRAVRDWGDAEGLELRVGLSLGRSLRRMSLLRRIDVRRSELFPHVRIRESRANLVVAHHALARLGVAAYARRRGLPLLVWTVDSPRALRYWLRPGRAWLVTSNHPGRALEVRRGRRGRH